MKRIAVLKYHGATVHRGARISVAAYGKKIYIPFDYSCNTAYEVALKNAEEIGEKLGEKIIIGDEVFIDSVNVMGFIYKLEEC